MPRLMLRIHLAPLYPIIGDKCPENLVRLWEGPLLPRKTKVLIPPGNELDIVWAKIKGHEVVFHKEEEIVFMELRFDRDALDYISGDEVKPHFIEAMKESGWKTYD